MLALDIFPHIPFLFKGAVSRYFLQCFSLFVLENQVDKPCYEKYLSVKKCHETEDLTLLGNKC